MPVGAATKQVKTQILEPSSEWLSQTAENLCEAVDDTVDATRRAYKTVVRTAEEITDDTVHAVKRHPLQSLAIAVGIGLAAGMLIAFLIEHRPKKRFLEKIFA